MKRTEKFVIRVSRLIFCIFVTLLFCRGIAICQTSSEYESLSGQPEQGLAIAGFEGDITLGILDKHVQALPSSTGKTEIDSIHLVPIPSFGVTAVAFAGLMLVGWLRRRTPTDPT